ncbi:MAG TPA: hypothetical protein PLL20_10595 [Phycisphaerae bacterium]|nr:hypothetical protein [Phycisphaerae bacterium]HRR84523.1 hypothetical protein [Phycisphaerae bacterium]
MAYAIELSARQSSRTLEQAVRHHAEILIYPRLFEDGDPIVSRLVSIETPIGWQSRRPCLVLETFSAGPVNRNDTADKGESEAAGLDSLVGTYCDVMLQLGENRYLFSSDVVAVQGASGTGARPRIYLARPETVQVAQRRRSWRFRPAQSSRVEMTWINAEKSKTEGIGWLCNVSAEGLACRTEMAVAEQLGIGEQVCLSFALTPGDPERFVIDAVLCNKTPAGTEGTMILGLQFLVGQGHQASAAAAEALRRKLLARYAPVVDTPGGAAQ